MKLLCPLVQIVCLRVVRVSLMYVSRPLKLCLVEGRPRLKAESERVDHQAASIQSGTTLASLYKIDSSRSNVVKAGVTCIVAGGENPSDNPSIEDTASVELPLPELCQGGDDQSSLSREQENRPYFSLCAKMSRRGEDGYRWYQGVLVHEEVDELGI